MSFKNVSLLALAAVALFGCEQLSQVTSSEELEPYVSAPPPEGDVSRVFELVNQARAKPRTCGDQGAFQAAPPLTWDDRLAAAAQAHSDDMAAKGYFSHDSPDGTQPADRVTAAGYPWSYVGENIAAGQSNADEVMRGWLSSPGHCANIMSPNFTQIGVGFAQAPKDKFGIYWTQTFGTPR